MASVPNTHMECGLSTGQGLFTPVFVGFGCRRGERIGCLDVCVATHMRGLVFQAALRNSMSFSLSGG
jgi:hypothetical protein